MTCLVAIKYEEKGKKGVVVAADSLSSSYGKHRESQAQVIKIIKHDEITIASSGCLRTCDIIEYNFLPDFRFFSKNFTTKESEQYMEKTFIPDLIRSLRSNKVLEEKTDIPLEGREFRLVVAFNNEIYTVSSNFALIHCGEYTARGRGSMYALGSITTSLEFMKGEKLSKLQAKNIAEQAIISAARFDFSVDDKITFEYQE